MNFLPDNLFVVFCVFVIFFYFDNTVCILMSTNCAPFPADLLLYSHEAEFIEEFTSVFVVVRIALI